MIKGTEGPENVAWMRIKSVIWIFTIIKIHSILWLTVHFRTCRGNSRTRHFADRKATKPPEGTDMRYSAYGSTTDL